MLPLENKNVMKKKKYIFYKKNLHFSRDGLKCECEHVSFYLLFLSSQSNLSERKTEEVKEYVDDGGNMEKGYKIFTLLILFYLFHSFVLVPYVARNTIFVYKIIRYSHWCWGCHLLMLFVCAFRLRLFFSLSFTTLKWNRRFVCTKHIFRQMGTLMCMNW